MIESVILIGGLVLFSSTVHYDMHQKLVAAEKGKTEEKYDKGFYQDIKKIKTSQDKL